MAEINVKKMYQKNSNDGRRKLCYFGHNDDGKDTLYQKHHPQPALKYITEGPPHLGHRLTEEESRRNVYCKMRVKEPPNLERFLVAPERKNVWERGIRSLCEGVLSAKTYHNSEEDRGVYTVIPEIDASHVSVADVYKMWLALECAMIRQESLIIVEDPALADVTKFRTEQWRLLNRFVRWGSCTTILFAAALPSFPSIYTCTFCLAIYGYGMLRLLKKKDPASRYSEISVNKQCEQDPESHIVCDAQVSMRYLRCPQYRMFKLEDHEERDEGNFKMIVIACAVGVFQILRGVYRNGFVPHMVHRGYQTPINPVTSQPLNLFEQLKKRFFTFGNTPGAGRSDSVHWMIQNGLFYYFFVRHIPWAIQTCLEYCEREHVMATTIRYLQFRNLCGEERYEFPARNLYWTMQKDYPDNRVLKEMYDHFNDPPEGYYQSEEFLSTRKPEKIGWMEAIRRWKISYYRNW